MERGEMEEIKRHFGVVAEGLRADIRQVAEGVANVNETLGREIAGLCQEVRAEFSEVKALIKFSYTELDRRIATLETEVTTMKTRIELLEAR